MAPRTMMAALLVMMILMDLMMKGGSCKFNPIPPVPLAPQTLDGVRYSLYSNPPKSEEFPGLTLTKLTFKYEETDQEINVTKSLIFNDGNCETSGLTIDAPQASCGVLVMQKVYLPGYEAVVNYNIYNLYADDKWWLQHTQGQHGDKIESWMSFIELSSTDPNLTLADIPSGAKKVLENVCGWTGDPEIVLQYTTETLTAVCSK